MKVEDAIIAFMQEHGHPPTRVYVSPILEAKIQSQIQDVPMFRPANQIALDVMGTDWYLDASLPAENFRLEKS